VRIEPPAPKKGTQPKVLETEPKKGLQLFKGQQVKEVVMEDTLRLESWGGGGGGGEEELTLEGKRTSMLPAGEVNDL